VVSLTAFATVYLTVAGLVAPDSYLPGAGTHAGRTLSLYEGVRSIVLVGALTAAVAARAWTATRWLLILNAVTQFGDAIVGAAQQHRTAATVGPLIFALALGVCAPHRVPAPARRSERGASLRRGTPSR
jgi:hypothetical protein